VVRADQKIALGLDICGKAGERCFRLAVAVELVDGNVRCSDLPRDSNTGLKQAVLPGVIVPGRPSDPNCRSPLCGSALRPYDHGKSTVNDAIDI
jgi:hypothetical protein